MELQSALVLAGSVVVLGVLVAASIGRAARDIKTAVMEVCAGIYERGERPEVDYPLFDEELARIHLDMMGEEPMDLTELSLEYDPADLTL